MRFNVRQVNSGWGVWDSATQGLRTVRDDRAAAELAMLEMNLAFDTYGQRAQADRRRPPKPVPVQRWVPAGHLIAWVRDRGGWIGAVRDVNGEIRWIASTELRRSPDPPS